jgi:hypothetical protein
MNAFENAFERTARVGRELFEINTDALRRITELSAENFKKYLELNQEFLQKLPESRELDSFVALQREYGENLWKGVQDDLKARGEILREVVEGTGEVIRGAFTEAAAEGEQAAETAADAVREAAAA